MLLHVLDAANPAVQDQHRTVLAVLKQLGLSSEVLESRVVEVWNKVDLLQQSQGSYRLITNIQKDQHNTAEQPVPYSEMGTADNSLVDFESQEPAASVPVDAVPLSVLQGIGVQELLRRLDLKLGVKQHKS